MDEKICKKIYRKQVSKNEQEFRGDKGRDTVPATIGKTENSTP